MTLTPIAQRVADLGEDAWVSEDPIVKEFLSNVFTTWGVYDAVSQGRIDLSQVFEEIESEDDWQKMTGADFAEAEDLWLNNGWVA